ncbi:unannotated protein [freshwater metagenome]|uniref:Unannotated protein n=1 Tax=freshwater metagenome TaxID=449393 RepID=A0A6J7QX88_9ZZZZ
MYTASRPMSPPMMTSRTRHRSVPMDAGPMASTNTTAIGIWICPATDHGITRAARSAASTAMKKDHQVSPTRLTHSDAASTPMPVPRMR